MTSDDDSDIHSIETSDTSNNHLNDDDHNQLQLKLHTLNDAVTAMTMQMCDHLQYLIILRNIVPAVRWQRGRKRNQRWNVHRDQSSVMSFIHSWSDDMFKQQFRLSHPDFFLLEATIMENLERKGYDYEKHARYATRSSGSPMPLELRLYTL